MTPENSGIAASNGAVNVGEETQQVRPGEELDCSQLENYLIQKFPNITGPLVIRQFPGGASNLTYLIEFGDREMVLRRPPFGNQVKSAHDMGREYRVLSKLHEVYFPAPRPLIYCEDDSVLGAPFYAMERRRGVILRNRPDNPPLDSSTQKQICESLVRNLADLHRIDFVAAGLGDLGRPEGYARRQVEGWTKRYYTAQTDEHPELDLTIKWLNENLPATHDAAIVHNDYKFDNIVLDPNDLTRIIGVLDWEMCTIGDPLMDLGTTLGYWIQGDEKEMEGFIKYSPTALPGSLTRRELAEKYAEIAGRDLSKMLFYYTFGLFKIAVIIQQIYARYVKGYTQDQRFANNDRRVALLGQACARAIDTGRY